jgi:hypothetical protein
MYISSLDVQSTSEPKNTVTIGDDCDEKAVFPVTVVHREERGEPLYGAVHRIPM